MELNVKVWKNFHWKKRIIIIREKDFQIKKREQQKKKKKQKQKEDEIHTYPLIDTLALDQSKNTDYELLLASKDYKIYIKCKNDEDKNTIIQSIENIIKENTFQNIYKEYNEKMSSFNSDENEISLTDYLCCKLFLFKNLMNEMTQKIKDFKNIVKPKPKTKEESDLMRTYNSINAVQNEMNKQFQQILTSINKYFDINENLRKKTIRLNKLLSNRDKNNDINNDINITPKIDEKEKDENENGEKDNDISSDDDSLRKSNLETSKNLNIENKVLNNESNKNLNNIENDNKKEDNNEDNNININIENKDNNTIYEDNNDNNNLNINSEYKFLSYNNNDFQNKLYNFKKRTKYPRTITYPQNIIKEMITSMTQNKPAPVYFNEPISMGQRQCEKFYYLNILKKVCKENQNKSLQLGYISAFIIGEIFLSLNRNLKPFNPILGETYEFFDNENNFRYYSEQVCHHPQITAFIGETPDFALYGDTKNSTSFKILKGAMELSFKNKIHLHIKSTNEHFTYTRPNIMVKGFLKPPLHNDYNGTISIENELFPDNKAEIKFIEESWTNSVLGLIEGKIYNGDDVIYLIKGNWNNNIYLIDNNNKDNKIDLLTIEQNQEYLKNGCEGNYALPTFCYNLNYMDNKLEESLPGNDSRFRKDMRFLEESVDTKEAQKYKEKYEEKQRKELNNENHKVLFFDEKFDKEGDNYFIPNGKYWEMKKNGELKNNCNCEIFDVSKY